MKVQNIGKKTFYNLKVVYTGLHEAGKTANINYLAGLWGVSVADDTKLGDKIFSFDTISKKLYDNGSECINVSALSVPGKSVYRSMRKKLMEDMDIMVFVVDLDPEKVTENIIAYEEVKDIIKNTHCREPEDVTTVIQFNKRDLVGVVPFKLLNNFDYKLPRVDAIADKGIGVEETFNQAIHAHLQKNEIGMDTASMDIAVDVSGDTRYNIDEALLSDRVA